MFTERDFYFKIKKGKVTESEPISDNVIMDIDY